MSHLDRLYAALGFGTAHALPPETAVKGCEYGGSRVVWPFSFADRLRILLSGKIMVDMAHMMDRPPKVWESTTDIAILPPNYPMGD